MNEQIRVRFTSQGQPLPVVPKDGGLILHGETSAAARNVVLEFDGFGDATRMRMRFVRERKNWPADSFKLRVSIVADGLVIAGEEADTLPAGIYQCRLTIDDLKLQDHGRFRVEIHENKAAEVVLSATDDPRQVRLTRAVDELPSEVRRVLSAPESTLDAIQALAWLDAMGPRASRKACLLNVVAKLAADQSGLLDTVKSVFFADVDRVYCEVSPQCMSLVQRLADDPRRPFVAEGTPKSPVHFRLLDRANAPRADYTLRSFRQEGTNCLQAVIASPRDGRDGRHFADFDIDLGNPLQDVAGLIVHIGELANPGRTDHFELRERFLKSSIRDFICYDIVEPHVDVRMLGV